MKKLSYLLSLYAIAVLALLSSCGKDDDPKPAPTISFIPSETTVTRDSGTTYELAVTYNADQNIQSISVDRMVGSSGGTHLPTKTGNFNSDKSHTETYSLPVDGAKGGAVVYTFTVTDKDGVKATKSITINVTGATTITQLTYVNNSGVINNKIGPNPGAFNLVTNTTEGSDNNTSDMQNPTATGWTAGWDAETSTRFVKANSFNYETGTAEAAAAAYAAGGTPLTQVTNVANGDIYIAKLRGTNQYAVIKINNVDIDIAGVNTEKITFSYKKTSEAAGQ